jgi:16S rRNA G966 N2-methylase RsmD
MIVASKNGSEWSIIRDMPRQLRFDLEPCMFLGDNLPVLQKYIADESVDLIYLDPPFNSNKTYNIFRRVGGHPAAAQIKAFDDTWRWSIESEMVFRRQPTCVRKF